MSQAALFCNLGGHAWCREEFRNNIEIKGKGGARRRLVSTETIANFPFWGRVRK
jgi:hypothetical protein